MRILAALATLIVGLTGSVTVASSDFVRDTRQILAGSVTTKSVQNLNLSGARNGTPPFKGALAAYSALGTTNGGSTPSTPQLGVETTGPMVGLMQLAKVPTNLDGKKELVPAHGTGAIAGKDGDVVGAFRFICNPAHLSSDDPIVYPGAPGNHLHQYFGNTKADRHSTYESLRATGDSTCNSSLNRSAYWMPAMMNGKGKVVRPDYISIYYKRRPASAPECDPAKSNVSQGICVDLPRGLRYVFGFNMQTGKYDNDGKWPALPYFTCEGQTSRATEHYNTIPEAAAVCPTTRNPNGSMNQLAAIIVAPDCWDGKNLDSPDHRSHVAYATYGSWGYLKCPATHPYVIPTFTMGSRYTIDANAAGWHLSSDVMPGMPRMTAGSTFHADWFGAWDDETLKTWTDNCINKMLSCSAGDLGNGMQLKPFVGFTMQANPRLVPIPAN
jgi:hypothetical protein